MALVKGNIIIAGDNRFMVVAMLGEGFDLYGIEVDDDTRNKMSQHAWADEVEFSTDWSEWDCDQNWSGGEGTEYLVQPLTGSPTPRIMMLWEEEDHLENVTQWVLEYSEAAVLQRGSNSPYDPSPPRAWYVDNEAMYDMEVRLKVDAVLGDE